MVDMTTPESTGIKVLDDRAPEGAPDISFFVPCLNEEKNITETLLTIVAAVKEVGCSYEILVIDDKSTDRTVEKVEGFIYLHRDVPIVLKKNARTMGLGRNYIDGAYLAKGKYYMLINGDNAEPKEAIVGIISKLGTADMIIPYMGDLDQRRASRRALSSLFTALVNFIGGHSIKYYNGPVAHLRYNVMRWHPDTEGFAYQAEIITRLLAEGGTYTQVQAPNKDRQSGITKAFTLKNFLSVSHSLLQILLRRLRKAMFG